MTKRTLELDHHRAHRLAGLFYAKDAAMKVATAALNAANAMDAAWRDALAERMDEDEIDASRYSVSHNVKKGVIVLTPIDLVQEVPAVPPATVPDP